MNKQILKTIKLSLIQHCLHIPAIFLFISTLTHIACTGSADSYKTIVWKLEDPDLVGGLQPEILGAPSLVSDSTGNSLSFNGVNDGLIIPVNPVDGWDQFTVEVLFKPAKDGPAEQRFVHFQDEVANRGLIETRVTPEGHWALDTFLYNSKTDSGLTLIDRGKQHQGDQWYWAALTYDGKNMTHYINAEKETEGEIEFGPMESGQISLGVRLNEVYWFKGQIREIRFHSAALDAELLQQP